MSHKEDFVNSNNEKKAVLEQVRNQCTRLQKILDECSGMKWLTCYAYVTAWQLLHSAEEVFILVEPLSLVVSDAMHDLQIIQNSALSNQQQLLKRLKIGIAKLSPHIESYLSPLNEADKGTQQSSAPIASIGIKEKEKFVFSFLMPKLFQKHETVIQREKCAQEEEKIARAMLLQVRRELNKFRDESWLAILKQRNRLAQTIALTGGVTYFLLSLSLVIDGAKLSLIAATAFYCVGALAGLFILTCLQT